MPKTNNHKNKTAQQKPKKKPSAKALLLGLACKDQLCHTTERIPVAVVDKGEQRRSFIFPDKEYEAMLAKRLYDHTGIIATGADIKDTMRLVEAHCFEGPCRQIFTRVGAHGDAAYIDLGDSTLRVIKVTANGWSIEDECPILFHRSPNISPMPVPVRGGSVSELRPLLNVTDEEWPIVVVFLMSCLNPNGPFPILSLNGQAGAAKTSAARLIQGIVDSTVDGKGQEEVFGPPKTTEDLMVFALHSRLLSFDNVSKISDSLSEAFCRLTTGGATIARKLYTNNGVAKMSAQQPVLITAVNDCIKAEDLRSRTLFLNLEMVDPDRIIGDSELRDRFNFVRPRVMGALLDGMVCAFQNVAFTRPIPGNRLADMTKWVLAAEPALGFASGTFAKAISENRRKSAEEALESPLAKGIRKLADEGVKLEPTEICERLSQMGMKDVPNATSLGIQLRNMSTEMAAVGIRLRKRGRNWHIERMAA